MPCCASSLRIWSPSAPSSAANTAFESRNAKGSNGRALVGATSPSVAPAMKNSSAPLRKSANILGSGPSRLSGNTSMSKFPARLLANRLRHLGQTLDGGAGGRLVEPKAVSQGTFLIGRHPPIIIDTA